MRTIVQLSDLHFGRLDPALLDPLRRAIADAAPDLLAVSGDLTQRARAGEFEQARDFLESLPYPRLVVPGNHDVPVQPIQRLRTPLREYTRYMGDELAPFFADGEMAVLGINTARSVVVKGGRINLRQIACIEEHFCGSGNLVKVLVTHHPFDLPERYTSADLVGRARAAMSMIARCGIDLLLAGHFHVSHAGHTADRYNIPGHSAVFVQAGTLSTRRRGEPESFNLVMTAADELTVERYSLDGARFHKACEDRFHRAADGWVRA